MSLPFIPGTSSLLQDQRPGLGKTHSLTFRNGVAVCEPPDYRATKKTPVSKIPSELKTEGKAIKFDSYFEENVFHSRSESKRIRKCVIHLHLEDESITILEPRVKNSGIPQGALVKRGRIPKVDGEYFGIDDFEIGQQVTLYGKTFTLCDADIDSKIFLEKLGKNVTPITLPDDEYTATRQKIEQKSPIKDTARQPDPLKQFLENDGKVLRYFCYWDDRGSLYGDFRKFKFHYFLADDTIEVVEQLKPNCGRDPFKIKRQKPPRELGQVKDIMIGTTVTLFSRSFVIYDVDSFTKDYLKRTYGITDFTPLQFPVEEEQKGSTLPPLKNNPNEDTSFRSLVPKPPKKNFQKMLDNDRKILRFSATLKSEKPEDVQRVFILSFFLADDTMSIYEPPQRNSGIQGGKFLERRQVMKPNSTEIYSPQDFYVGSVVEVFRHRFVLHDADEYAFNFMEANPEEFKYSDIEQIHRKLVQLLHNPSHSARQIFNDIDTNHNSKISLDEFREALIRLGANLTEQEIVTLVRRYDLDGDGSISYEELLAALSM